ncbi:MAG: hypothetical protein WEA75_09320 [Acidimicrobiia bacterium]
MKRGGVALTLVVCVVAAGATAVAAGESEDVAAGFVTGREHEVRVRPVLDEVASEAAKLRRAARTSGEAAVASCDPLQASALRRKVPTTPRDGDDPAVCVVLATSNEQERLMLGPAQLTGSEFGRITLRRARRGRRLVVARLTARGGSLWAFLGAQNGDARLAFTLDGEVLDLVVLDGNDESSTRGLSFTLGEKEGFSKSEAERLRGLLEEAEQEDVIELGREASLSREGRELFADTAPVIREKADFVEDCPLPEADDTFVLGCYDQFTNEISILRVDRLDIRGVMPVTAAHEMLHAAYERLGRQEREKVNAMIEEFVAENPQPRLEESLTLYTEQERANELHSLVGTEVSVLSRALERHYAQYFDDRAALIALFAGYQSVFDNLETRFEQLEAELDALDAQLGNLEAQANAAGKEADSLANQIDELRAQGRFDEANNLVGPQNTAVDRANSLGAQYNAVVNEYNAKVAEANAIADSLGDLYGDLSPVESVPA